jgi:hypothetical protein
MFKAGLQSVESGSLVDSSAVKKWRCYGVDTAHAVEPSPPQIWIAEMSDETIPPSMIMPSSTFDWDTPDTLPGNEIMTQVRYSIRGGS